MRHVYRITWALIALGFVATAIVLVFAPDTIPAHFNAAGQADRYGSKYELLLFPAVSALMGAIFLLMARAVKRKGLTLNEKILLWTALGEVVFFHGLSAYFMWKMLRVDSGADPALSESTDCLKFFSIFTGLLLIVLGNVMPKARKNTVFGLRTKWSLSSDEAWRKSQRFGGFASVIAGVLLAVLSVFLEGAANLAALTAILLVWFFLCVAASFRYGEGR